VLTERLVRIIKALNSLPTLPTLTGRLFELVDEGTDQKKSLEQIVSGDPVLTERLLKKVNTRGESITSVHSAITKLGFEQAKDICMEVSMSRAFELKDSKVDLHKFWDHSNAVGVVARIIAQEYKPDLAEDAHSAGLLHDIGKVILMQFCSTEFEEAIALSKSRSCELNLAEMELLGMDHGQVGALYAENRKDQRLPRSITEVIQYHHDLPRAEINRPLVALVGFADILCRIFNAGDGGNYAPPSFTVELATELGQWGIDLEPNALRPFMAKCIEELGRRNLV
jgi:HD-like signal output (HDOD) protein